MMNIPYRILINLINYESIQSLVVSELSSVLYNVFEEVQPEYEEKDKLGQTY